ncbi:MAG: hypothetical protein EOR84_22755 [Mesorhizobium sp.]|uniref:hypothetical protein n=1 Tax=Mesorhizobium sp. TaxID=1871066 RepID=UPI000FE470E0|nr:hypothetical protein [Mesorhizobium sp.]RWM90033.1 MAG: hypothetical protein EOR84_22755 [Mesorhizobium sp.]
MGANPSILLRNMRLINPLDFKPEDVDIPVALRSLSRLPRYGAQTNTTYRVAEHVVKLYRRVPKHLRKAALLHDLSEGFGLLDLPHPIKRAIDGYSEIEKRMLRVIFAAKDEPWAHMEELEQYDRRMCQDEMLQVFDEPWDIGLEPLGDIEIEYWSEGLCEVELRIAFLKEGLLNG